MTVATRRTERELGGFALRLVPPPPKPHRKQRKRGGGKGTLVKIFGGVRQILAAITENTKWKEGHGGKK